MTGQRSLDDEELAELEQRVSSDPEGHQYIADLADAYAERGQWNDAIRAYEKAVVSQPENAVLFNDLGTIYEEAGDLQRAEEKYREALRLEPKLAAAHLNLGLMYQEQERIAKAISHLEQCLAFSTDSFEIEEARTALGRFQIRWVQVAETAGSTEGEFIAGLLRSEGIPAQVSMEGAADAMGIAFGPLGVGRVLVPESFLEEAQDLLSADVVDDAFDQIEDPNSDELTENGGQWWNLLAKGMLGLAAIVMSPIGVVIALLLSRSSSDQAENNVTCPHCGTDLELDGSELIRGWYICPECDKKAHV